jgi:hypothetical protein
LEDMYKSLEEITISKEDKWQLKILY